jgi:FkbM family methyltransferase
MTILNMARRQARKWGLECTRADEWSLWNLRLRRYLEQHEIKTVLDVGANDGGYATELLQSGWRGKILSFEPLPEVQQRLEEKASRHEHWSIAPPAALSDRTGKATFHETGNSYSSSLLQPTDSHLGAAPDSGVIRSIEVDTIRLDDFLETIAPDRFFLKLDVQGAEALVLAGATEALRRSVMGVQMELSLVELYQDQRPSKELEAMLHDLGFRCWDILPGFRNPDTMRLLQYDGIYFRGCRIERRSVDRPGP